MFELVWLEYREFGERITHVAASPETPDPTTATFMVVLLSDQIAIKEKQTYWRPAIKTRRTRTIK